MALRYFGVDTQSKDNEVTEGAATSGKPIELRVDLSVTTKKSEIIRELGVLTRWVMSRTKYLS